MPEYAYRCDPCGKIFTTVHRMGKAPHVQLCPKCGGISPRCYAAMLPRVHADPQMFMGDFDDYQRDAKSGKQVRNRSLSRSLARVPGLPKVKGRDGKPYVVFETKKARREILKRVGIESENE